MHASKLVNILYAHVEANVLQEELPWRWRSGLERSPRKRKFGC